MGGSKHEKPNNIQSNAIAWLDNINKRLFIRGRIMTHRDHHNTHQHANPADQS
jgi:hypothetical protein